MMKVVLITDPHVTVGGEKVKGIDPVKRLNACVSAIQRLVPDADLCVLMGDNVNTPTEAEYRAFLDCLSPLKMPKRYLIGNHDDRDMFVRVSPDLPRDKDGHLQSVLEAENAVFLFLDTGKSGDHSGHYSGAKLFWLKEQLRLAGPKPVYLFMHHPPFRTGFWNDHSMVQEPDKVLEVISEAGNVRHIFIGHTHRATSGNWRGITWSTLHGTCYENDFELLPAKPNYRGGPAQIGVLLVDGEESAMHFHDILDPYPLIAYSGKSSREPALA